MQIATIVVEGPDGQMTTLPEIRDRDGMWKIGAALLKAGFHVVAGRENWKSFLVTVRVEAEAVEAAPADGAETEGVVQP